jgi:hypothetical protein
MVIYKGWFLTRIYGDTTVGPVGVLLITNNNKYRVKN